MLCRYRGCGIRGVLRGKRRLPTLRKPRRTPSEGRERSSAFPREVCAFGLLCFFAHGGFQFPRDISHPDKRRRPSKLRFGAPARRAVFGFAEYGRRRRSRRPLRAAREAGSASPRSYLVLAECADLCSADIAVVVFAAFCGENGDCRH